MHRKAVIRLRARRPRELRRTGTLGAALLVALFVLLMALRGWLVYGILQGIDDCPACLGATATQQDLPLLALLLAIVGLAFLTRHWLLQLPALVAGAALLVFFAADVAVMKTLAFRLYVFDIGKFGGEVGAIETFGRLFAASAAGKVAVLLAIVVLVVAVLSLWPRPVRPRLGVTCLVVAAACFLGGRWQPSTMTYIHTELLQNVVSANLALIGVNKPLSPAFAAQLAKDAPVLATRCEPGQNLHPDVIVVLVESLSSHHSALFGGLRDLTPRLDAMARANAYVADFFANGFTTDGGLIAIATGQVPVPAMGRYGSTDAFAGFGDPTGALPDLLHGAGYVVNFFTTGDLHFLDKPAWLAKLHFDSWEGAEAPFYNGWKRRHFDAAEDKALYQRYLQWLDAREAGAKPVFSLLLTVSTHPPFINPDTDANDEAGAFAYADRQIGVFYDELAKRGFFEHGILIVTGDHRTMAPLHPGEAQRFGASALARVPLVVATGLPLARGAIAGKFQQTDVLPSLADLTGTQACRSTAQGAFLRAQPEAPEFVMHARGDRRDALDVFFGDHHGSIVLDGDATHFEGDRPPDWQAILDGVMLSRMQRGAVQQDAMNALLHFQQRVSDGARAREQPAPAPPAADSPPQPPKN